MVDEKNQELDNHINFQFKHKEIPEAVKIPQYDALKQKELKKK